MLLFSWLGGVVSVASEPFKKQITRPNPIYKSNLDNGYNMASAIL
jgi:hypothetical protein